MKNLLLSFLVLFSVGISTAQTISTFPYTQDFSTVTNLGWTVDNGTNWYIDTVKKDAHCIDHSATQVHWNLYTPWFNTSTLTDPILTFYLLISDDNASGCVPELDLSYDDNSNAFYVIRHISTGSFCSPNDYDVVDSVWAKVTTHVTAKSYVRYVFRADFIGTGEVRVSNVWMGEANTMGINEIVSEAISVIPNPAKENSQLMIKCPIPITAYSVYNSLGQIVLNGNQLQSMGDSYELNMSSIPPGIYFLNLQTNDGILVKKIVIN